MAPNVKQNDRVIIEIRSGEVFEGNIEHISSRSIELYNIFCQTANSDYEGNMTFYRDEVVSISHLRDSSQSNASTSPTNDCQDDLKEIKMHPDEFVRLKQMTFHFTFIDRFGTSFDDALKVLNSRESVAVVGLGSTFTRGKPLSLLLMADFKQVFIFDMFCLVELRGLRDVLESEFICKVVHDGAALFDCLYHKYELEMNNVFDTQIVDCMTCEDNSGVRRNLSECLGHHLNFPTSLLSAAMDDMNDRNWIIRPVIKSDKIKASQLVTYLITLRDHLVGRMLRKYTDRIKMEYGQYKQMSDVELLTKNITLTSSP